MIKKISGGMGNRSGFTLIEILIVVALLAILAVAMLVALNPAAAQQKARDSQRLKEAATMQAIVEQYVTDNPTVNLTTNSTLSSGSNNCATGWFGTDVCSYANVLPVDPSNKSTAHSNSVGGPTSGTVGYQIKITAGNYRICTKLESKGNAARLTTDGVVNDYFEVYNTTAAAACTL